MCTDFQTERLEGEKLCFLSHQRPNVLPFEPIECNFPHFLQGRDLMEQTLAKISKETEEKFNAFEEFGNEITTRLKAETEEAVGLLNAIPS